MSKPEKFWDYWEGRDTIVLMPQMVHAKWGKNPQAIEFTNFAFNVYYRLRRNTEKITDATLKQQMIDKLEEAAKSGWGIPLVGSWGDLEKAFEKLSRPGADRNQWTDEATSEYKSNQPSKVPLPIKKTIWDKGNVIGPVAAVNFLTAMDKNIGEFYSLLQSADQYWNQIIISVKNPRHDWNRIGATLKQIGDIHSKTSKYLWLAPERFPGLPQLKTALDKTEPFLHYVKEIYDIADNFLKYQGRGYTTSEAAQIVALKRALECLPVLGEFYSRALDLIPNLKDWFVNILNMRKSQIDTAPFEKLLNR